MKTGLDHLPAHKQRELEQVQDILRKEFKAALAKGTAAWKKQGRILKIILFGSYTGDGWVDEERVGKGYQSDYDLLVVVNNKKLADFDRFWRKAKDRLLRARDEIRTPVSFIVHSRRDVNQVLKRGQYFFSDIRKQGIVLYELDAEPLAESRPLTPKTAHKVAKEQFEDRFPYARCHCELFDKARYSKHHETDEEALAWLGARTRRLHALVEAACRKHLARLAREAGTE